MEISPKKKALVFIDHDLIIRHFIHSGAFAELEQRFEVTYVFNDDPDADGAKRWIHQNPHALGLRRVLITHVPRKRMGSWFKLYIVTVLHNQRGMQNYPGRKLRVIENVGWLRAQLLTLYSLPGIYPLARRRLLAKQGQYEPLAELLRAERPDLIVQPSILTGYYLNELLLLSRARSIPYLVLMNSWDNPSQKAAATGNPDKLVVWGEQTRRHAVEYMRMPQADVHAFGAAQFQVYRQTPHESEAELRTMFRVPAGKPVILYAGVSKSIDETRHLRLLEDAIEAGGVPPCHVLYRPHPWRGGLVEGEQDFFAAGFHHISMDPFMEPYYRHVTSNPDAPIDMADYAITVKLLRLVSGTISSLSTVLIETLMQGKPVISFMPRQDMASKYGRSAAISQKLAHFHDLWGKAGVIECHEDGDLAACVRQMLSAIAEPGYAEKVRETARFFVVMDGDSYGTRVAALAESMVSKGKALA
jgi:hypothetical protein